ncbi:Holliday junction resolvase RuvX [Rickettsiales endosymbiont of Peranema trichophorum]|uniref:Holliday junction resolvase RuvX n=1 Tax=Rickettsiales endosymbiont of Peranema trichophorum TaxID=2486577 RepID=UPI001023066A|nr:Holliday junction resolvase RuvX [Rickettsiales endosymbiont of Peranema trichophorum]RZI45627.1 Holliday junction resolvase RuvX [Rickettsiales endosymbiont of Peranema trichophorum]
MIHTDHHIFLQKIREINLVYRLMSMDIGNKRIGTAVCTSNIDIVIPHKVLFRSGIKSDLDMIVNEIQVQRIDGVVVGLPLSNVGQMEENSRAVQKFTMMVSERIDTPIIFYDERYTTKMAHSLLKMVNMKRKKRHAVDDQLSASIILEGFVNMANLSLQTGVL